MNEALPIRFLSFEQESATQNKNRLEMSDSNCKWNVPFMTGTEIRKSFIEFFKGRQHDFIVSSPVVPPDDPTLLFINAGMNQFKALFLGDNRLGVKRAVNSQKCLRVSGKHNDLDEVGRDTSHHTLFEMLGNWSFGDYYKKEAISWAWKLLTEEWKIPKERLFVTVFKTDDEAFDLWKEETDIEEWRILRFGESENFWEMGEVGPCGPCSEIHFDLGDLATQKDSYNLTDGGVNGTDGRFVEIWNLVFMQYERQKDKSLKPLKETHVDTGMGFERIASIIQGVGSNYEIDMFSPLINKIAELTGIPYEKGEKGTPHRVIADHIRALSFAIADGATPGNEGRGYVLRRILRRASRFSSNLGQKEPFIYKLVPTLVEIIGEAFPELGQRQDYIVQVIEAEEQRFMRTLGLGIQRLEKIVDETRKSKKKDLITGENVFLLYDTFGFPVDLTEILANEKGLTIDHEGFEVCMAEQRERARSAAKFDTEFTSDEGWTIFSDSVETEFVGYECLSCDAKALRYKEVNDDILLVLSKTPFYAESGGQIGDRGTIVGEGVELGVSDTFKVLETTVHRCHLLHGLITKENLEKIKAHVDEKARNAIIRNHSATHLLHAALRKVLGDHVQQQGSRVSPDNLRFDFTHQKSLSKEEIGQVQKLVNLKIQQNIAVGVETKTLEKAKNEGAIALFGEKYAQNVRTIKMGEFSYELCGGNHVSRTGDIGVCFISSEGSIAAGVRRIEALTASGALSLFENNARELTVIAGALKAKQGQVAEKVEELVSKNRDLEKELKILRQQQLNSLSDSMIGNESYPHGETKCIVKKL